MENVKLWENGAPYFNESYGQPETDMTPYIVPETKNSDGTVKKTGCVIVCPGGGYEMRADHEGGPVCEMFNRYGISGFVLNYRLSPYRYPSIVEDVNRAVRWVRYHAEEYNIDPEKIAVLGFSAGGHLATASMIHYDGGRDDGDEIDRMSCRPDAAMLCYAVITLMPEFTHMGTRVNLLGGLENEEELARELSGELNVKDDSPAVFMWHTAMDDGVPVQNALNMGAALREKNIPFELHIFPEGGHGLGLAEDVPGACEWGRLAADWLLRRGY